MSYAETAATAIHNTRMTTTNVISGGKSNSRRQFIAPQYFLDYINNSTISGAYPSVTSHNGAAIDKQRFLKDIAKFKEALSEHPEFKDKVLDYYCSFDSKTGQHSSGVIQHYLHSTCIPKPEIIFNDPQEAHRIFKLHLEFLHEYFKSNPDFYIQLPNIKANSQLVIIKLDYDHEIMDLQELLYERVLKPYGSLVYQQLPPPQPIIEQTRKFSAYHLLDFTSDTIPPTTMDPFANFQPITDVTLGKVTVTIQSNLKFCSYYTSISSPSSKLSS
ncbi:unnamed protein product [[Candida] boidinii]|nr:unnamed protein product [[Candida] boidinii]